MPATSAFAAERRSFVVWTVPSPWAETPVGAPVSSLYTFPTTSNVR